MYPFQGNFHSVFGARGSRVVEYFYDCPVARSAASAAIAADKRLKGKPGVKPMTQHIDMPVKRKVRDA